MIFMPNCLFVKAFTLEDFVKKQTGLAGNRDPQAFIESLSVSQIENLFFNDEPIARKPAFQKFMKEYLLPNCFFEYCYWVVSEEDEEEERFKFRTLLASRLRKTAQRYLLILEAYETQRDKLLDRVKSVSKSKNRFNDTPQGEQNNSSWEGNEYVTNLTMGENEAESDVATPMARLKEIENDLRNVYADWLADVSNCFFRL